MSASGLGVSKVRRSWKVLSFEAVIVAAFLGLILVTFFWLSESRWVVALPRFKSQDNLHEIGLAIISYADHHKCLPPAAFSNSDGKPLYSWRVLILPYLDETALYNQFHLDEPWNSAHNKQLISRMPSVYAPVRRRAGPGETYYQVLVGRGTAFEANQTNRLPDDFPDGTSKTILVVEGGEPVPWTKPEDVDYDPDKPMPRLGGLFRDGFCGAFADGSVRFIPRHTKEETIRALITRNGGEKVEMPDE